MCNREIDSRFIGLPLFCSNKDYPAGSPGAVNSSLRIFQDADIFDVVRIDVIKGIGIIIFLRNTINNNQHTGVRPGGYATDGNSGTLVGHTAGVASCYLYAGCKPLEQIGSIGCRPVCQLFGINNRHGAGKRCFLPGAVAYYYHIPQVGNIFLQHDPQVCPVFHSHGIGLVPDNRKLQAVAGIGLNEKGSFCITDIAP